MKIGFSAIIDTTNEDDIQKLAQLMQVFVDQSSTTSEILISKAVAWKAGTAAEADTKD